MNPLVGIIMGSDSDLAIMQASADILKQFDIAHELEQRNENRLIGDKHAKKHQGEEIFLPRYIPF